MNGEYVMESDLINLLKSSNEAKPVEFQSQLNDVLGQRVAAAIERQKQEMAQSLFVPVEDIPDNTDFSDNDESENEINNDEIDLADTYTGENDNDQDS